LLKPGDPSYLVEPVWAAIRTVSSPEDVIERAPELRRLANKPSRKDDLDRLIAAASAAADDRGFKEDASWRLALVASPSSDRSILYTGKGILRVVARVTGTTVDRDNQGSDGRILAARMVGVEESRDANLALLVIGQSLCLPVSPRCGECPLHESCAYAGDAHLQMPLELESSA
jgi:hypothetical protein